MIRGLLLAGFLAAAPLQAQFAFSVIQDSTENAIGAQFQLAPAAAGDTVDTLFRVRNAGKTASPVTTLSIAGSGFALENLPPLGTTLAPGDALSFTVRFHPGGEGMFSALLKTDGLSVFVLATASPALTIYMESGGVRRALDGTAPLDFGVVERGSQDVCHLTFVNQTALPLASTVAIVGAAFQLVLGGTGVVALDPQASQAVDLVFAPRVAGPRQGELRVDQRRFGLQGATVEPPLPRPIVTVDLNGKQPASGLQPTVAIHFDPAPRTSGTGTLRIDFYPAAGAADDPAILFLAPAARSTIFSPIEGEDLAQFGPSAAMYFQTGTTAGTIVFTAELGDYAETFSLEIPPQPVAIQSVALSRGAAGIEVQVSGYDNTRSIRQAAFTFLQKDGSVIPPGAIQQDVSGFFSKYFADAGSGGAFQMKATFPVNGSASAIDSVKVVLTNAVGQASWPAGV